MARGYYDLKETAAKIYRMPSVHLYIDLAYIQETLAREMDTRPSEDLPLKIASSALKFGRIKAAVVYINGVLHYENAGAWIRAGIEPSMVAPIDINLDVYDRCLVESSIPEVVVLVSANPVRKDLIRRLRKHVNTMVLVGSDGTPDMMKRSANYFITLNDLLGKPLSKKETQAKLEELVEAIQETAEKLPYVGFNHLVNSILKTKMRLSQPQSRQLLQDAERAGVVSIYDHYEDGKPVKACKLLSSHMLVKKVTAPTK